MSFNEGYSNAVRKPITLDELMRGFLCCRECRGIYSKSNRHSGYYFGGWGGFPPRLRLRFRISMVTSNKEPLGRTCNREKSPPSLPQPLRTHRKPNRKKAGKKKGPKKISRFQDHGRTPILLFLGQIHTAFNPFQAHCPLDLDSTALLRTA